MSKKNKAKILIFEDDRNDYQELVQELGSNGLYEIIPNEELFNAFDSGTSLEYVKNIIKRNWDKDLKIIICDLLVKNTNLGKELIDKIRNDEDFYVEDCKSFSALIPIIVYSSTADQNDIDEAIENGANSYVQKPIKTTDMRMKTQNAQKVETLKKQIKKQISCFEKKLQLIEDNFPNRIKKEIIEFKAANKNKTTAFIMTSFAVEHKSVADKIIDILKKHDINGYIADAVGGKHSDDLLPNIEVFMYGCDFGIGIYADDSILENNEKIRINSNLSFEVGYMLSMQKQICILKDKKLTKLNSDLCSKIYVEFDKDDTTNNLEQSLTEWLRNKKIIV